MYHMDTNLSATNCLLDISSTVKVTIFWCSEESDWAIFQGSSQIKILVISSRKNKFVPTSSFLLSRWNQNCQIDSRLSNIQLYLYFGNCRENFCNLFGLQGNSWRIQKRETVSFQRWAVILRKGTLLGFQLMFHWPIWRMPATLLPTINVQKWHSFLESNTNFCWWNDYALVSINWGCWTFLLL